MRWAYVLVFLLFLPVVSASIGEDVTLVEERITEFIGDDEVVLVQGHRISLAERFWLGYVRDNYPAYAKMAVLDDSTLPAGKAILVGGPTQNRQSVQLSLMHQDQYSLLIIGRTDKVDGQYLILSDFEGFAAPRTGPARSPLAPFIPEEYIPAVAAVAGLLLLWLWQFLATMLQKIFRLGISSKVMKWAKRRDHRPHYKGFKVKGIRFKYREWWSIFIAAAVFAFAAAYGYWSGSIDVLFFTLTSIVVNMAIYAIRHIVRLVLDAKHTHHTEYVTWWWGAVITILTGWLGNTFALAGYTVSAESKPELEGKIQYFINLFTFIAALIFLVLKLFILSPLLQMMALLALSLSVIQMLPFAPFAGKNVRAWKTWLWWLTFVPMLLVYIATSLLL